MSEPQEMMSEVKPSVSVVVTTFNHAPYIAAALRSVLNQTYPLREVIVVDDGSSDRTPEVLAGFAQIKGIRQKNRGVAGSRNRGVSEAKGDLIALMDGDDLWEPEKLARQVSAFEAHPDSGLIACDARQLDGDTIIWERLLLMMVPEFFDNSQTDTVSRQCYERLLHGNFIGTTSQVMIPRDVLRAVGPSDSRLATCSDYDLYLRIAAIRPFTFVNAALTSWRYLPTSASGPAARRRLRWAEDEIAILKKQLRDGASPEPELVKRTLAAKVSNTARLAYDDGSESDRRWALRYLWHLAARNPADSVFWIYLAGLLAGPRIRKLAGPWGNALLRRCSDERAGLK
jgi:glycosyltransferase involved in cell wall biosynthesis